jgi:hypothetical protein
MIRGKNHHGFTANMRCYLPGDSNIPSCQLFQPSEAARRFGETIQVLLGVLGHTRVKGLNLTQGSLKYSGHRGYTLPDGDVLFNK